MKLLLPTCLGLAAVANAWTGDNCKRFADIYTDGAGYVENEPYRASQRGPSG